MAKKRRKLKAAKERAVEAIVLPTMARGLQTLGLVSPKLMARLALRLFTTPDAVPRPDWEKRLIKRGRHLRLGPLSAHAWGKPGSKRVLLVHGWRGRGAQLGALVEPLVERGFEVIALDGPAHGDSEGKRASVGKYLDALLSVGRELGEFHGIVAHSIGAVAATLAISRGMKVGRFVIVAAPSERGWIIDGFSRRLRMSPAGAQAFREQLEVWDGIPTKETDIARVAPSLDVPTLVVHDPDDKEVPFENAERIVASLKGARLVEIRGVGHRRILKATAFLKAVEAFLTE